MTHNRVTRGRPAQRELRLVDAEKARRLRGPYGYLYTYERISLSCPLSRCRLERMTAWQKCWRPCIGVARPVRVASLVCLVGLVSPVLASCDDSKPATTGKDTDRKDAGSNDAGSNNAGQDSGQDASRELVSRCAARPKGEPLTGKMVSADGPYSSKLVTFTFVDTTRPTPMTSKYAGADTRTLDTSVWYPADAEGNLADGEPFPLLVWSHGFSSTRFESDYVSPHLATRGYIIAAPAFPLSNLGAPGGSQGLDFVNQPGDVSFIIDAMLAKSADPDDPLAGSIDPDRIGLSGLSVGAATTLISTFHVTMRDQRVKAAVSLAAPGAYYGPKFFKSVEVPLLAVHGTIDAVLAYDPHATTLFDSVRSPAWLVKMAGGTHTAFTGFANEEQPDSLGCNRINTTNSMRDEDGGPEARYERLGGTEVGFNLPPPPVPADAITCKTQPLPASISGERQHALTTLLLTSFFDMHFALDAELRNLSCQFLEQGVARENKELKLEVR